LRLPDPVPQFVQFGKLKIEVGCVAEEGCKARGGAKALLKGTHLKPQLNKNGRCKLQG
jgi:hypothetical protein